MNNVIELAQNILATNGAKFASFLYTSKGTGETAKYVVVLGANYLNLLEKSLAELLEVNTAKFTDLEKVAFAQVKASLEKSIAAHREGKQNEDYTKKGQYRNLGKGLNVNDNDGSLQLFGLVISKTVIVPGVHKKVNSAPLTIAKSKLQKELSMSKFREFALDTGNIHEVKANGETLEFA